MKPPFDGMLMAGYHHLSIAEVQVEPEAALSTNADRLASDSVVSVSIARNMPGCASRSRYSVAWEGATGMWGGNQPCAAWLPA